MKRYSETQQAIAALSADARAMFDVLPTGWMESGWRRRHIEHRLNWPMAGGAFARSPSPRRRGRFDAARDELVAAGLVEHRGGGVYARTLEAVVATGGRTGV